MAELTFKDAVIIARGCMDYGGGYRGDDEQLAIYRHGIQTVINALEHAAKDGLAATQIAALYAVGTDWGRRTDP